MSRPRKRLERQLAGAAHSDAFRGVEDQDACRRYGSHSRRSWSRFKSVGHPLQHELMLYMRASEKEWEVVGWAMEVAKALTVERWSLERLYGEYIDSLAIEPEVEAEDAKLDVSPTASMIDRSNTSRRNGSLDLMIAAMEAEIHLRGKSIADVWEWARAGGMNKWEEDDEDAADPLDRYEEEEWR